MKIHLEIHKIRVMWQEIRKWPKNGIPFKYFPKQSKRNYIPLYDSFPRDYKLK